MFLIQVLKAQGDYSQVRNVSLALPTCSSPGRLRRPTQWLPLVGNNSLTAEFLVELKMASLTWTGCCVPGVTQATGDRWVLVGQGKQAAYSPLPADLGESWGKKDAKSEIHTRAEGRKHLKTREVTCFYCALEGSAIIHLCVDPPVN